MSTILSVPCEVCVTVVIAAIIIEAKFPPIPKKKPPLQSHLKWERRHVCLEDFLFNSSLNIDISQIDLLGDMHLYL